MWIIVFVNLLCPCVMLQFFAGYRLNRSRKASTGYSNNSSRTLGQTMDDECSLLRKDSSHYARAKLGVYRKQKTDVIYNNNNIRAEIKHTCYKHHAPNPCEHAQNSGSYKDTMMLLYCNSIYTHNSQNRNTSAKQSIFNEQTIVSPQRVSLTKRTLPNSHKGRSKLNVFPAHFSSVLSFPPRRHPIHVALLVTTASGRCPLNFLQMFTIKFVSRINLGQ